jgi:hypothetical protein
MDYEPSTYELTVNQYFQNNAHGLHPLEFTVTVDQKLDDGSDETLTGVFGVNLDVSGQCKATLDIQDFPTEFVMQQGEDAQGPFTETQTPDCGYETEYTITCEGLSQEEVDALLTVDAQGKLLVDLDNVDTDLVGTHNCQVEAKLIETDHTGAFTGYSDPVVKDFEIRVAPCQVSEIKFEMELDDIIEYTMGDPDTFLIIV